MDCLQKLKTIFNVRSILVEGGAEIIHTFLERNCVDKALIFVKYSYLGGYRVLQTPLQFPVKLKTSIIIHVKDNLLIYGSIEKDS